MSWWTIVNSLTPAFRAALNVALDRLSSNFAQTSLPSDSTVRPGMLVYLSNRNSLNLRDSNNSKYLLAQLIFADSVAPTIIHQHMLWHDTANNLLKRARADNATWETVAKWNGSSYIPYRDGVEITALASAPLKLDAIAAPTVDDDDEYAPLSIWKNANITAGKVWWICRDNAVGAAVWDYMLPVGTDTEKSRFMLLDAAGDYSCSTYKYIGDLDILGATGDTCSWKDADYPNAPKLADAKLIKLTLQDIYVPTNNRSLNLQLYFGTPANLAVAAGSYNWIYSNVSDGFSESSSSTRIRMTSDQIAAQGTPRRGAFGDIIIRQHGADVFIDWKINAFAGASPRNFYGHGSYIGAESGPITGVRLGWSSATGTITYTLTPGTQGRVIVAADFNPNA